MIQFRFLDYIILVVFLGAVVSSLLFSSSSQDGDRWAEVDASGERYLLPLSRDGQQIFMGPVGETVVQVSGGMVLVSRSDCRDGICVAMGPVSEPTGWIACLPNRVFIRVVVQGFSNHGGDVDAGAY